LWEAFLLQMNDFDRYLETELRVMLNPVVARRPPPRRGRRKEAEQPAAPLVAVDALVVETIPVVVPVVTVPVASARSL
jgi:hypothetical protein